MPVSSQTLRRIRAMRILIDATVDAATRDLVGAWGRAWQEVVVEWRAAVAELFTLSPDSDEWVSRRVLQRAERAQQALQITSSKLEELGKLTGVRVERDLPALTEAVVDAMDDVAMSQLPKRHTVSWTRVSAFQIDAIVRRTTRQIHSSLWPLSTDAVNVMRSVLIRGVIVGDNPKAAARLLISRLEGGFNGGLARAMTITRTEMLDATRAAGLLSRQENRAVLAGWRWLSTLSARTCPSCLSMHGTLHDIDEAGPLDHQSGRCTAVPVVKPWRDLGIDLPESANHAGLDSAQGWFDRQPAKVQLQIMGPKRLAAYRKGRLGWSDMAVRRSTPGWRDSYVPVKPPR